MTIYSDKELSIHEGQPVECYEFAGTFQTYRYTSADVSLTLGGNVYTPLALERSSIRAGTHDEDNIQVQVRCPITATVVKDYGFQITPPALWLTIYRAHRGTDFAVDFAKYWQGPVTNISIEGDLAIFTIPSAFASALAGSLPSIFYQTPCNHVLFDSGCKVSRASNSVDATVVDISGSVVQISTNGGFPDGFFLGGEIADTSSNNRRMIIAHAADQLTVNYPFGKLAVGTPVQVTAGCDHAFNGDCKSKYDNQINFGGHPFIPSVNPFAEGL